MNISFTMDNLVALMHELSQCLLSLRQFTTPNELGTEQSNHTVNHDKAILSRDQEFSNGVNKMLQALGCISTNC
jgi:hypothetical protein